MRQQLRLLGILAATGIAAAGLSACGVVKTESFEDSGKLSGKITSVRLENSSGGITVTGTEGGGAPSLRREVSYANARPQGPTHRIENGVLVLGGCGDGCSVRYTVDVPAGIPVTGAVTNGSIHLTKVGSVQVKTGAGQIEMTGVNGPVDVRTVNGRITGSDVKGGRIQAQTSNGSIDLTLAAPLDVQARTINGGIDLTVPGRSYRISAQTNNAHSQIGLPDDPSGRNQLTLKSINGAISVKNS